MTKKLSLLLLSLALSGCSLLHVHKIDIEQGNILSPEEVRHIHTGMTREEVKDTLGTPILINTFNDNREDYVYSFKPGYGVQTVDYMTLIFAGNRLKTITGNLYSPYIKSPNTSS